MRIDPGLVVIIAAVLAFYLRLIILQRQRAKRAAFQPEPAGKGMGGRRSGKKLAKKPAQSSGKRPTPSPVKQFSIISDNKRDWIIAGAGIIFIVLGVLLNLKAIPLQLGQNYWWLPVAIGIVAFSWGFK